MRKILIIILIITLELVLLTNKLSPAFIEKINLKLKPNELAVSFLFKNNKTLLLNTKNKKMLIIIDLKDEQDLIKELDHFNSLKIDYLLGFQLYDIESDNKIIIKDNLQIEDILIKEHNHNLQITYLNHNFCFYFNDYKKDFTNCHYVYLANPNDDTEFLVEPELILYDKLNEEFTEEMYDKWIDTFYLDAAYYNVIKLNSQSYNIINIPLKN